MSEICYIASSENIAIFGISESDLNSTIFDAEVSIPNYNIFREDRVSGMKGGGSAFFVKNDFIVEKLDWFKGSESIALKLKLPSYDLYVICLYRSPSLKTLEQNQKLLSQIALIPSECDNNVIIMGDINLPNVDWNRGIVVCPENSIDVRYQIQNEYLDLFIAKGFSWFVHDHTRIRKVNDAIQKSTLDQVFCNNENIVNSVDMRAPLGKSDHLSILVEIKVAVNNDYIQSNRKNWFKVKPEFIINNADNINWSYSSRNLSVECMWNEIYRKMLSISDLVPFSTIKLNNRGDVLQKHPWDTSRLVRKRKEKDQAWKAFDDNPIMSVLNNALYKQKEFSKVEFQEKIAYEKKLVKGLRANTKPFFRYLRSKNKVKKTVSELDEKSGERTKTPADTAEILSQFFQSVFQPETYGPLLENCYQSTNSLKSIMEKLVIQPDKVKKLLSVLNQNKSMGPDNLHPKLLKFLAENSDFVNAITALLNKCIEQECIPAVWKNAVVIPLHKKGSVHLAENYRPVSLTCILCKLYETLLREHILFYVSDIITNKQHGFSIGKSCLSNLLETLDLVNEYLADSNCVDILYFDFSKAFDTVSHYRLLIKLEAMGFSTSMLNIIRNFLSDRYMEVRVGDAVSKVKPVLSGVPQGSVLGPLLFLLFVNDLPETIINELRIFADDVKMIVRPSCVQAIQEDLDKLIVWENMWLLRFNLDKCKVLHMGKNNPLNKYNFLGSNLCTCSTEKDLGVIFNEKCNFHDHIYTSISKAKSSLAWLLRSILSREPYEMITAYRCLVRHNLEYCCQVWSPKARFGNWKTILDIESVQRTFTRCINGMQNFNYRERLSKLNMTTLLERRMRGDLIETFKILNSFSNYGTHLFNLSDRTQNLVCRSAKLTNIDFFSERVLNYWNKLPAAVKDKNSVNAFKNTLDDFRTKGIENKIMGQFWELSEEIYKRIYV